MPSAILSASARLDVAEAVRWIAKDSRKAAFNFRSRLDGLLEQFGDYPEAGMARPELAAEAYRFAVLRGFPYIVVYNARRRPPVVMRVLHGSQDLAQILNTLPPPE